MLLHDSDRNNGRLAYERAAQTNMLPGSYELLATSSPNSMYPNRVAGVVRVSCASVMVYLGTPH